MPPTKLQRWLDLIAYLVAHHFPVTVDELMEHVPAYAEKWRTGDPKDLAAVRRTFERDKDELRRFGIPIQTVSYTINYGHERQEGYRIAKQDFYLPYLRLLASEQDEANATAYGGVGARGEVEIAEDDAQAALEALRRIAELPSFPFVKEARSAFRKLAFDLDPESFPSAPVLYVERPGAAALAARVRLLSDALLARKRVRFRYRGIYRGEVTERDVAPYGLLFQQGHWYLIGHDATRDAVRVFRIGRMADDVAVNTKRPNSPDYEVPDDFRLDDYARREAWELGGDDEPPLRALVRFRFPASLLADRNGYGTLVESHADGSAVRAFEVAQVGPFLRWLLSQEGEAEVLEPTELAAELRRMAGEVAAAHVISAVAHGTHSGAPLPGGDHD